MLSGLFFLLFLLLKDTGDDNMRFFPFFFTCVKLFFFLFQTFSSALFLLFRVLVTVAFFLSLYSILQALPHSRPILHFHFFLYAVIFFVFKKIFFSFDVSRFERRRMKSGDGVFLSLLIRWSSRYLESSEKMKKKKTKKKIVFKEIIDSYVF